MRLLRSFPLIVFVLVLLSIGALCAAQQSLQLLLVAGTLAAISWYITEGPRGWALPKWVSNLLVIGFSLNVFGDFLAHRDDPLGVLGRFVVFLTLVKLYERKSARDHAQLMLLSLLLMITGCLQAPADFRMGIALLVYSVLGLYVLLLYQLHAAYEQSRNARSSAIPSGYRLVPPLRPIVGRRTGLHFRSQAFGIGAVGVMLSVAVFVGIPRDFGADIFGGNIAQSQSRITEYVNQIDLVTGGRLSENRRHVMSVRLTDDTGRAIKLDGPLLLRGGVCDRYEGRGRWRPAIDRSQRFETRDATLHGLGMLRDRATPGFNQRVISDRAGTNIFSVYAPVAVSTGQNASLTYDLGTQILRAGSASPIADYVIRVQPLPDEALLDELVEHSTQGLPRGSRFRDQDSRVQSLAQLVLARAGFSMNERGLLASNERSEFENAAQVLSKFLQSGEYQYTVDLSDVVQRENLDPITQFLTETKRGHCQFFASGLAAMCQSVGIPARIVTGYISWEYDEAEQQYNVYESNAHAWVEVLTGKYRWTPFDPTPAQVTDEQPMEDTFADTMRSFYQRIEGGWSSRIVEFDSGAQDRLADSLNFGWSQRLGDALQAVRDWMERVNIFFNVGPGGYIWMGIVAVALAIAVIALIKLMRRSLAIRRLTGLQHVHGAEYQRLLRQLGFYLDMLRVLRRGGLTKPDWQPPLAFAQSISKKLPDAAQPIRELTDLFYAARYGGHQLEPDEQRRTRELLGQLAVALKVRV